MAQKIYTRKGDKGFTSIMGTRERYPKYHDILESVGTIDELNCYVGMVRSLYPYIPNPANNPNNNPTNNPNTNDLEFIQNNLFEIGAILSNIDNDISPILEMDIKQLELKMDIMSESLQPLKNFILPAGNQLICYCHLARTVCRRAERCIVRDAQHRKIDESILKYINRLSDYFFVLARKICLDMNLPETIWTSNNS